MSKELIKLPQTQLAYAQAIVMITQAFESVRDYDYDAEDIKLKAEIICGRLRDLGNLREPDVPFNWQYLLPLDDLFEFSDEENNLLLDLYDNGGVQSSRTYDKRFDGLGQGSGIAKGAISLSAQHNKWTVRLTDRGREYIERVLLQK